MTSYQANFGVITVLLMSCRQRAQAFADRLRSWLTTPDSKEINGNTCENSWLSGCTNSVSLSQPKPKYYSTHDNYLNFVSSHGSTEDEVVQNVIYKDNFEALSNAACQSEDIMKQIVPVSSDSDSSDCQFYDCQSDLNISNGDDHEPEITQLNDVNNSCNIDDFCEQVIQDIKVNSLDPCFNNITEKQTKVESEESSSNLSPPKIRIEKRDERDFYIDDEDDDDQRNVPTRVIRCSSLKTGKTLERTPGQKKIVRFADVLGLELADVKTFLDEIPKIPVSAFNNLENSDLKTSGLDDLNYSPMKCYRTLLVSLFEQPGGQPNFIDRVRDNYVSLDSACFENDGKISIRGVVRVRNIDFHKSVIIRYTLDSWHSFTDTKATYVENSCDGFSDKFSFVLYFDNIAPGQNVEFAVKFQCQGCQYWDNNNGKNYCFQSVITESSISYETNLDWQTNFY